MINMLSVDVEDYHQLVYRNKLGVRIPPTNQVAESTLRILHILREYNTRATFFVLGTVAEHFPELVQQIARAGHEVATHGYSHRSIAGMTPEEFSSELSSSLSILRELTGQRVVGHRAPVFSLNANCSWAFDVMVEHGIAYDSSVFPIKQGYNSSVSRAPYAIRPNLIEVPLSILEVGRARILLGGSYFRLCPYRFSHWAIRRLNREGLPAVVYLHPYEFDTAPEPFDFSGVPIRQCLEVSLLNLQYRINRSRTEGKLRTLLIDFRFTSILDGLKSLGVKL